MTSGQITEGKECATNAFLWEKFSTICFCLKRNHIASQKFLMRESRYFNGLSRELNGFVTIVYLLVTSEVPNEGVT